MTVMDERDEEGSAQAAQGGSPSYWKRLLAEKPDRHIELFLTFAITFFAAVQWITSCQNNKSTTAQTGQLITAANINAQAAQQIADASKRNATAAETFSTTAGLINGQMEAAVAKLNLQAGKLGESVRQASRLASDTEKANENVLNSDRPWVGIGFDVDGFEAGKTPTYRLTFLNSGKRPAKLTITEGISTSTDFGNSPSYLPSRLAPSTVLLVPGQQAGSAWKDISNFNPMTKEQFDSLQSGLIRLLIYGNVEYTDLKTGTQHWTHICLRYTPKTMPIANGFSNCSNYNDAQ